MRKGCRQFVSLYRFKHLHKYQGAVFVVLFSELLSPVPKKPLGNKRH